MFKPTDFNTNSISFENIKLPELSLLLRKLWLFDVNVETSVNTLNVESFNSMFSFESANCSICDGQCHRNYQ